MYGFNVGTGGLIKELLLQPMKRPATPKLDLSLSEGLNPFLGIFVYGVASWIKGTTLKGDFIQL